MLSILMTMISSGEECSGSDRGPPLYVTLSQLLDSTMINLDLHRPDLFTLRGSLAGGAGSYYCLLAMAASFCIGDHLRGAPGRVAAMLAWSS